jgi:cytochrome c peroxidase
MNAIDRAIPPDAAAPQADAPPDAARAPIETRPLPRIGAGAFLVLAGTLAWLSAGRDSRAQVAPQEPDLAPVSLKSIPVPRPSSKLLARFVADEKAAIALGKALFWDTAVGSDNATACASCHFQAGADGRVPNQLNPGHLAGDLTYQFGGPNHRLTAADFPFLKTGDQWAQGTLLDTNDVAGSHGVFAATFDREGNANEVDLCADVSDDVFHGGRGAHKDGLNTRQTTGRNAPTVINAVYNFRNFWDGRANNVFNGGDPFGMRNPNALVWRLDGTALRRESVRIPSSSLASQGSGPPLSEVEMSCTGRSFVKLGKKLLKATPLAQQLIAPDDSVLADVERWRRGDGGLTYAELVKRAFQPAYWRAPHTLMLSSTDENRFAPMDLLRQRSHKRSRARFDSTQMEANFALFFGLAVQLYQSTLIANDTPFDRYLDGQSSALSQQEIRGFEVFAGQGKCLDCHGGAELTNASFRNVLNERLERMTMGDGGEAVYDNGFYNIGVRPSAEDIGVGGTDPFGKPLSESRMVQLGHAKLLGNGFNASKEPAVPSGQRLAIRGAFKTPGLRNVEFTGPYFHNGGQATLMQVVDFYDRGGDFADTNRADLAPNIQPLGLSETQKQDLVAFMLALSDDRVRYRRAPFDHPSICVPHGHRAGDDGIMVAHLMRKIADDDLQCLSAIGRTGTSQPLPRFLYLSPFRH